MDSLVRSDVKNFSVIPLDSNGNPATVDTRDPAIHTTSDPTLAEIVSQAADGLSGPIGREELQRDPARLEREPGDRGHAGSRNPYHLRPDAGRDRVAGCGWTLWSGPRARGGHRPGPVPDRRRPWRWRAGDHRARRPRDSVPGGGDGSRGLLGSGLADGFRDSAS